MNEATIWLTSAPPIFCLFADFLLISWELGRVRRCQDGDGWSHHTGLHNSSSETYV